MANKIHRIIFYVSCLALLLSLTPMQAQLETRNARLTGADIINPAYQIIVKDDKFTGVSGWNSGYTTLNNKAMVELGINEEMHLPKFTYTIIATFDVELTAANLAVTNLSARTLTITYNPNETTKYKDKAQLVYSNYYKIKVSNISMSITPNGSSWTSFSSSLTPYPDLYLQAEVSTDRVYNSFSFASVLASGDIGHKTINTTTQEVEIYWNFTEGATAYELDYTYVDNYDGSGIGSSLSSSDINYDLDHDATRIVTSFNYYRIPLTYERGYLVYRVRPIGINASGQRIEGLWAGSPASGNVAGSSYIITLPDAFSQDYVNWESTKTFAEDGKTGTGVSFGDGLNFKRQSQARLNTEEKNIVQSTLYDHYGRPAVHFLPAPVNGLNFDYRFDLNNYKASPSSPLLNFDKRIFDLCKSGGMCGNDTFPLSPDSSKGATNYYSPYNPNHKAAQGYLPDARNLAYTLVKYKPDPLGRVSRQTMPGGTHWLGSGKDIQYFYAKPSQVELDRLFGSEAAKAMHCYKNFIIDPNGQISTTYIDMYGRTIATALVGNKPFQLDELPDKPAPETFTDNLSPYPSNYPDSTGNCKEINTTFFVSQLNDEQGFIYETNLGTFAMPCDTNICFECVYDIDISIKDECGLEIFEYNSVQGYTATLGPQPPYTTITCNYNEGASSTPLGTVMSLSATPIKVTFPHVGAYTVYKKICVSDKPLRDYTKLFLELQTCKSKCSMVDSLLAAADFSGCKPKSCESCMGEITNYKDSILGTLTPGQEPMFNEQWLSKKYEECMLLCPPKTQCEKYSRLLEADFYPGSGQYAITDVSDPKYAFSIFNPSNMLHGSAKTWDNPPLLPYYNANGDSDHVVINGIKYSPKHLTQQQFITHFRKSWAKALLPAHPEYCKLAFYCNTTASNEYDDAMRNLIHYDTVCGLGYQKPIPFNAGTSGPSGSCDTLPDPITAYSAHAIYGSAVTAFMNEINSNVYGSGKNIYQYIAEGVYNTVPDGHYFGSDPCTQDIEWSAFKSLYLTKKQGLYMQMLKLFKTNLGSFGFSGGCEEVDTLGFKPHFPNWNDSISSYFNDTTQISTMIASSAAAASFGSNSVSYFNALSATKCDTTCHGYVELWKANLVTGCPGWAGASAPVKDSIISAMVEVCKKGCNPQNINGASSVNPAGSGYTLPGTSVVAYDFQDVLNHYLDGNTCNAVVINMPAPYPPDYTFGNRLNSCKCDQILQVKRDFFVLDSTASLPSGITAPWQLFRKKYGFDMHEFNMLACFCDNAADNSWWPGHSWTTEQNTALASYTFPVNPKLSCPECLKCSDIVTAINNMEEDLPSSQSYDNVLEAITQDTTNQLFAINSLNKIFGPHPPRFYIDMYEDCQQFNSGGSTALTFSNTLTWQAWDFFRFINDMAKNKRLAKDRTMSLCTDKVFYLSGLYNDSLPVVTPYDYDYTVNDSILTVDISYSSNSYITFTLTLPYSYGGTWNDILSFHDLMAWCPSPAAGPQYSFKISGKDKYFADVPIKGRITNMAFPISHLSGGSPVPAFCPGKPKAKNQCMLIQVNNAITQGEALFTKYTNNLADIFKDKYKNRCFKTMKDSLLRIYEFNSEHHYTLYYYDQAGNLQRTVPPKGVEPLNITTNLSVTKYPKHSRIYGVDSAYVNDYKFNSYNQPVIENTADGGQTIYLYDKIGRLMASQNARQAAIGNVYSYTLYDDMGRVTEVGEALLSSSINEDDTEGNFAGTIAGASQRRQVIRTFYDSTNRNIAVLSQFNGGKPTHLRNRVARVIYQETYIATDTIYNYGTFFSYDEHGNVKELVQHQPMLDRFKQGKKKIVYNYELISGNMVQAIYQPRRPDQFIHKYHYDPDNRLHLVYSSRDSINWDRDAKYFYYEHGPLARIERADEQVQGMDYLYTIHGWVKSINSDVLKTNYDAGKDGAFNNLYMSQYNRLHAFFARDAMAFNLNYYQTANDTDYVAIKRGVFNTANPPVHSDMSNLYTGSTPFELHNDGPSLYNGNISSMLTTFLDKDPTNNYTNNKPFPQLSAYRYDQLHRLTQMKTYRNLNGNEWETPSGGNTDASYFMNLTYDANGNILTLKRNGPSTAILSTGNLDMDDLTYHYYNYAGGYSKNTNRLACLQEAGTGYAGNYSDDIDAPASACSTFTGQSGRYAYDETGSLIKDEGECIDTIKWTVDRKVKKIIRSSSLLTAQGKTLPDIEYIYNAMRQRVAKIVKPREATTKLLKDSTHWVSTHYVYDASGNVMAVYEKTMENIGGGEEPHWKDNLALKENHLYGSSRLAIAKPAAPTNWYYTFGCGIPENCIGDSVYRPFSIATATFATGRHLGYKEFELNNHLGNVIAVVSDRKVMSSLCPEWEKDFAEENYDNITAQNANLSFTGGKLRVEPYAEDGGVIFDFNTSPGAEYVISFDLDLGTTISSDTLMVVAYDDDPLTGISNLTYLTPRINANGTYEFEYSTTMSNGKLKFYYASDDNMGPGGGNRFDVDNLGIFKKAPSEWDYTCPSPWHFYYMPDVLYHSDYYPGGQQQVGRTYPGNGIAKEDYRYGHNGMESDKSSGFDAYNHGARMQDPRILRWNTTDQLSAKYPSLSSYVYAANNAVYFKDFDGRDIIAPNKDAKQLIFNALEQAFGVMHGFDFDETTGKLYVKTDIYDKLKPEQKVLYEEFVTNLVHNSQLEVTVYFQNQARDYSNNLKTLGNKGQGEYGLTKVTYNKEKEIREGISYISPDQQGFVKVEGSKYGPKSSITPEENFWHEMGHQILHWKYNMFLGAKVSPNVFLQERQQSVGFQNLFRVISGKSGLLTGADQHLTDAAPGVDNSILNQQPKGNPIIPRHTVKSPEKNAAPRPKLDFTDK